MEERMVQTMVLVWWRYVIYLPRNTIIYVGWHSSFLIHPILIHHNHQFYVVLLWNFDLSVFVYLVYKWIVLLLCFVFTRIKKHFQIKSNQIWIRKIKPIEIRLLEIPPFNLMTRRPWAFFDRVLVWNNLNLNMNSCVISIMIRVKQPPSWLYHKARVRNFLRYVRILHCWQQCSMG